MREWCTARRCGNCGTRTWRRTQYKMFSHELGWACVPLSQERQTIELQPWGSVEGRVVLEKEALANTHVTISSGWTEKVGYGFETELDQDGNFRFAQVPGGKAQIQL